MKQVSNTEKKNPVKAPWQKRGEKGDISAVN